MTNQHHDSLLRLDLNLLTVFEVVFAEQQLNKAAEVLCVTPSAVSHSIKRLRVSLGDELFEKTGRRMLPTPYASAIAPEVIEILNQLRTTLRSHRAFAAINGPVAACP